MKTLNSHHTKLKILLLTALAANVSWQPAMDAINSVDFASETVKAAGGTAPGPSQITGQGPLSTSPNAVTVGDSTIKPQSAASVPGASSSSTANPTSTKKLKSAKRDADTREVCGRTYLVTYKEIEEKGEVKTVMKANEFAAKETKTLFSMKIPVSIANLNKKSESLFKELDRSIREHKNLNDDCKAVDQVAQEKKEAKKQTAAAKKSEQERIAKGKAECTLNDAGKAIEKDERFECNLERLASIKEGDGAAAKVERLIRDELKKDLKPLLLSKDSEKRALGMERLEQVMDTLEDIEIEADLPKSRADKLMKQLTAMKTGAEVIERASAFESDVHGLQNDFREKWSDYKATGSPELIPQLNTLNYLHSMLDMRIKAAMNSGPNMALQRHLQFGNLTSTEHGEFNAPFMSLQQDMINMLNIGASGPATNLASPGPGVTPDFSNLPTPRADLDAYRRGLTPRNPAPFQVQVPGTSSIASLMPSITSAGLIPTSPIGSNFGAPSSFGIVAPSYVNTVGSSPGLNMVSPAFSSTSTSMFGYAPVQAPNAAPTFQSQPNGFGTGTTVPGSAVPGSSSSTWGPNPGSMPMNNGFSGYNNTGSMGRTW